MSLLHETATRCLDIGKYIDEAIDIELGVIELDPNEASSFRATYGTNAQRLTREGPRHVLSQLYGLKGDMEQALTWAKQSIEQMPDPRDHPDFNSPPYDLR